MVGVPYETVIEEFLEVWMLGKKYSAQLCGRMQGHTPG